MASYITKDGDMVDAICWAYYGASAGYTEAVLEANYRLEDYPPQLPAGLTITLPNINLEPSDSEIRLWD